MKLRELLQQINTKLESVKNVKYNDTQSRNDKILLSGMIIETELKSLLRYDTRNIRLISKNEKDVFGDVGNVLFTSILEVNRDKRLKHGDKGTILKVEFQPADDITDEILDMELKDLQPYFAMEDRKNSIKWYNNEIIKLEKQINKYKTERDELIKSFDN